MHRRVRIGALAMWVMLVLAAGCDSGRSPAAPVSTAPGASSTSMSPRAAAEAQAIAAYDGMWQAMAKAAEVPDPDAPEVRQYAAEDALARVVGALVAYREH